MSNKVDFGKSLPIPFSSTKKSVAIMANVVAIVLLFSIPFLPIIHSSETESIFGTEYTETLAFSPFRLLLCGLADTDLGDLDIFSNVYNVKIHVSGGTQEENDSLEMLMGSTKNISDITPNEKIIQFLIILFIIIGCIVIPPNISYILSAPKKRKLAKETAEAYKQKYLNHFNQRYFDSIYHLSIFHVLSWIAFPFILLCACVTGLFFIENGIENYSLILPIASAIICLIILVSTGDRGGGLLLNLEWEAIVVHKYVYDRQENVFRARTSEERADLDAKVIQSMPREYQSLYNTPTLAKDFSVSKTPSNQTSSPETNRKAPDTPSPISAQPSPLSTEGDQPNLFKADTVNAVEENFCVSVAEEGKTEFDLELTSCGIKKLEVIKAVREITGLGLKDAKRLVENAPQILKESVSRDEAERIKEHLAAVGATVTIK